MSSSVNKTVATILETHQEALATEWLAAQKQGSARRDLMKDADREEESRTFLSRLRRGVAEGTDDIDEPAWEPMREHLRRVSRTRARLGYSASDTAQFIFSLKQPLFDVMRADLEKDAQKLADATLGASTILDKLALFTTEVYQSSREEIISRQQEEMMELSTPVVELWDGVLGLPLIGTLDSRRTQLVMEALLQRIVETGSEIAIIDITGVPTVDTLTAQHLIKTVTATRLMGAECIISGIRPQIAQTIVQLGVDLGDVTTKSSLAAALATAFRRRCLKVVSTGDGPRAPGED